MLLFLSWACTNTPFSGAPSESLTVPLIVAAWLAALAQPTSNTMILNVSRGFMMFLCPSVDGQMKNHHAQSGRQNQSRGLVYRPGYRIVRRHAAGRPLNQLAKFER